MPGLVSLISSNEDFRVDTFGLLTFASADPMRGDSIFRIASITKLVSAAATMILMEDCKAAP